LGYLIIDKIKSVLAFVLLVFFFSFSFSVELLSEDVVTKGNMKDAISQLKKMGMINDKQMADALKKVESMSDEDIKKLEEKAKEKMKNDPELIKKVKEGFKGSSLTPSQTLNISSVHDMKDVVGRTLASE